MIKSATAISIYYTLLLQLCFVADMFAQTNDKESFPFTGTLVDAGGHKLHLNIVGNGTPSVIMENGSGDFSFIWNLVQPEVAKFTRTVSYDRAGYAWSEAGPMPRTSRQICLELHTALQNAEITPPYILVGQSFGGFLVRAFARYYPKEVVGMVLVEAVHENMRIMIGDKPTRIREFATARAEPAPQSFFKPVKSSLKKPLTLDSSIFFPMNKLPERIQKMQIWAQSQESYRAASDSEMSWSPEDVARLYQHAGEPSYRLGNIPLIVLTRGKGGYDGRKDSLALETERLYFQKELSELSTNSKHIIDENSGHNIHLEDPGTVINAIKEVFTAVKENKRLR
jgi:pimeloyl-ACP methyl ester carboxylesterase